MQSFLQYRKFGKAVGKEQERHRTDRTRLSRLSSSQSSISSKASNKQERNEDPEKGEKISDDDTQQARYEGIRLPAGVYARDRAEMEAVGDMEQSEQVHSNGGETAHQSTTNDSQPDQRGRGSLSAQMTHQSTGTNFGRAMTGVNVRDRTTNEGEKGGLVFVVGYQGEKDPLNPHNWDVGIRVFTTVIIASIGFVVGVASAIDSSALPHAAAEFHVGEVVEALATGRHFL